MCFFKAVRVASATLLLLLNVACHDNPPASSVMENRAFDRAAAVARLEARRAQYEEWSQRYNPLSDRKKAGENVTAEIEALMAVRPGFADLVADAERIVQADPTDDAAFMAIEVAQRGNSMEGFSPSKWKGSPNEALNARMQQALLTHHIQRPDFLSAVYLSFADHQSKIDFWKQVLEGSPHPSVRASAALRVVQYSAGWAEEIELDKQPDRRQQELLRAQVRQYANLIKSEYPGEQRIVGFVNKYLTALDYSAGGKLADVEVAKVAGGTDSLGNYRGKIVLLDFWATWCGPCRRDHPKLIALKEQLKGRPFEIVSVSADEKPELVTHYLAKERDLPWPQWYVGPKGALLQKWGVQGYPTYLLVDGQGQIKARGSTLQLNAIMEQARQLLTARS